MSSDLVKLHIMKLLNEKYGLVESDFLSAELDGGSRWDAAGRRVLTAACSAPTATTTGSAPTPSWKPCSLWTCPTKTAVCILADKEEIGSVGISGMQSHYFEHFMEGLCDAQGVKLSDCFANSFCLSADVSNAFDPNWPEACDKRNNSLAELRRCHLQVHRLPGQGRRLRRFRRGYGLMSAPRWTRPASSGRSRRWARWIRAAAAPWRPTWPTGTLSPWTQVCRCSAMHAPLELVSKLDCYETMLACKAIYLA